MMYGHTKKAVLVNCPRFVA